MRSISSFAIHLTAAFLLAVVICGAAAAPSDAHVVAYNAMATAQAAISNTTAVTTAHPGVNGNPWGYNYSCCHMITHPAGGICSYFHCIPNFWHSTRGYVEECSDGTISHSGGRRGSCSYHGGNWRPLYRP